MIIRIGMFTFATFWMFKTFMNGIYSDYEKLIAFLLYFIITLLASRKEN